MTEEIAGLLGFLTQEFNPQLPEQLLRYHGAIAQAGTRESAHRGAAIPGRTQGPMGRLYDEISSFLELIEKNTRSLLKRTQTLKQNRDHRRYAERVREARILMEEYIEPLNKIVDLSDSNSIVSLLREISRRLNLDRFANHPPSVQNAYDQLEQLLRQVNGRLQRQSDIIRRGSPPSWNASGAKAR